MAIYECDNCGMDYASFPEIFVMFNQESNSTENQYSLFRREFRRISKEVVGKENLYGIQSTIIHKVWKKFGDWIFNKSHRRKNFCCLDCATNYLHGVDNGSIII